MDFAPINSILLNRSFVEQYGKEPTKNDSEMHRIQTHLEFVQKLILEKTKNEKKRNVINFLTKYRQEGKCFFFFKVSEQSLKSDEELFLVFEDRIG